MNSKQQPELQSSAAQAPLTLIQKIKKALKHKVEAKTFLLIKTNDGRKVSSRVWHREAAKSGKHDPNKVFFPNYMYSDRSTTNSAAQSSTNENRLECSMDGDLSIYEHCGSIWVTQNQSDNSPFLN